MLRALITWRELTDVDLKHCNIDSAGALNDDVIFPRNAVKQLFNYYYRAGDEAELVRFGQLIEKYLATNSYYCLFYARELMKILTLLQRQGRTARARSLLEDSLRTLRVLSGHGASLSVANFDRAGNYSYSYPVILFDAYAKLLAKQGDIDLAKSLLRQSMEGGGLLDDSVIMLSRTLASLEMKKPRHRFPVIGVKKRTLGARHLQEPTIELVALSFLRDELNKDGVVSGVDLWRRIPGLLNDKLPTQAFRNVFAEATGTTAPDSFRSFLKANKTLLAKALEESNGATFGAVGYPDLIMYDPSNLSDLLAIEVKDVNDQLRPHQEAVMNRFVESGFPCALLKFAR